MLMDIAEKIGDMLPGIEITIPERFTCTASPSTTRSMLPVSKVLVGRCFTRIRCWWLQVYGTSSAKKRAEYELGVSTVMTFRQRVHETFTDEAEGGTAPSTHGALWPISRERLRSIQHPFLLIQQPRASDNASPDSAAARKGILNCQALGPVTCG